ncbi:MAG: tetratricopeptide repeat protein [Anaerolineae bacterium]|nr:tetratricopeptide repeat protein [Anaerolineae bacterium]
MSQEIRELRARLETATDLQAKVDLLNELALRSRNVEQSSDLVHHALELATRDAQKPYVKGQAQSLCITGNLYLRQGEYRQALMQLHEAKSLFDELRDAKGRLVCLNAIGLTYQRLGAYPQAMETYFQVIREAKRVDDAMLGAEAFKNLGDVYVELEEWKRALSCFTEAERMARALEERSLVAENLVKCCNVRRVLGEHERALEDGIQGVALYRELGMRRGEVEALNCIGEVYLGQEAFTTALDCFHEALHIAEHLGLQFELGKLLCSLGAACQRMGLLQEAQRYLEQALATVEAVGARREEYACHHALARLYQQRNDYQRALYHFERYHDLKEAIVDEATERNIKQLEIAWDLQAARREAEAVRVQNLVLQREIAERQQVEAALVASESELQTFFQAVADVVIVLERNGAVRRIWSQDAHLPTKSPEDTSPVLLGDVLPESAVERCLEAVQVCLTTGQIVTVEYTLDKESTIFYEARISPLDSESVLFVARDITARVLAEAEIRESEERFRVVFKRARDALVLARADEQIIDVNDAACMLFGYSREALLGMKTSELGELRRHSLWSPYQAPDMEQDEFFEADVVRQDGEGRRVEIAVTPFVVRGDSLFLSVIRDVTERRAEGAELERYVTRLEILREIDKSILAAHSCETVAETLLGRLRRLIDFHRATVVEFTDGAAHVLAVFSDPGVGRALGLRPALFGLENVNIDIDARVADLRTVPAPTPAQRAWLLEGMRSYVTAPLIDQDTLIGALLLESRQPDAFSPDGMNIAREAAATLAAAIRQAQRYRDVERRSEALILTTRQAQEARSAAEAASEAKSAFLAGMSHELRTPLNVILGFAQLLGRSKGLTPEQQAYLDILGRSGEHLLGLMDGLLDISKIEAGRVTVDATDFDLYVFLDDVVNMFRLCAGAKGLTLHCERAYDVPRFIHADQGKLRQVLLNLLGNAVQYTSTGMVVLRVALDLGRAVEDEQRVHLRFEVEDTGPGISSAAQPHLFEPFFRGDERRLHAGTGLGLPISRGLVEMMGGALSVRSKLGHGSTFSFDIRVTLAEPESLKYLLERRVECRVMGLAPGQPRYRLLIADDHDLTRELLRRILEPLGFEIREAANGQQVLDTWHIWNPHLIWMDIRMPIMGGREALRAIKASPTGAQTVIIALTAIALAEDRAAIMSEGAGGFLHKPFREREVFEILEKQLGVCFEYEQLEKPPAVFQELGPDSAPVKPALLAGLPPAWLGSLQKATIEADLNLIYEQIAAVRDANPEIADTLSRLTGDFAQATILWLIENAMTIQKKDAMYETGSEYSPGR